MNKRLMRQLRRSRNNHQLVERLMPIIGGTITDLRHNKEGSVMFLWNDTELFVRYSPTRSDAAHVMARDFFRYVRHMGNLQYHPHLHNEWDTVASEVNTALR